MRMKGLVWGGYIMPGGLVGFCMLVGRKATICGSLFLLAAGQDCGYPGFMTSFVTYVRPVLNFPREGGQIAKKWSKNDPLVVGRKEPN